MTEQNEDEKFISTNWYYAIDIVERKRKIYIGHTAADIVIRCMEKIKGEKENMVIMVKTLEDILDAIEMEEVL